MTVEDGRRQRAVMATDAEWERICRAAAACGMDRSRYLVHRAMMPDGLPDEVQRRALREMLVLSLLEERRLRQMGAGGGLGGCLRRGGRVDRGRGALERLTDPGAANRWKQVGVPEEAGS